MAGPEMEMQARVVVALLLCAAFSAAPAAAQASETEILTDDAGDQVKDNGELVTTPPAYDNVDIRAVTASQPTQTALVLAVTMGAEVASSQNVTLNFTLEAGPDSLPGSMASGARHSVKWHADAVSGLPGVTWAKSGADLLFTIPLSAMGAVGGDVVADVSVAASDFNGGAVEQITQDDSSATDDTSNAGLSIPYTLSRPPVAGAIAMSVDGGAVRDEPAAALAPFAGSTVTVRSANATVAFQLEITNEGLDPDTVTLTTDPPEGTTVAVTPARLELGAGESATSTVSIGFDGTVNGTIAFTVDAATSNGARKSVTFSVLVDIPVVPKERTPVPEALGFLTPVVTAMGLDGMLGEFAELAFLLFVVLLLVVVVYLLLFTVKTPWVRVRVTPRKAIVAPGGVAEFHVEVAGRKRHPALARATLRTEGAWVSGLQVGRSAARPGESMDIPLESGKDSLPQEGILRVQVPYDAPARDRQELEFDVVPVDSEGGTHPKHASRSKVTVEAAAPAAGKYASARDIRLAEVKHDPPDPRPGATVHTTATIHNEGPVMATLRVVLQKDGKPVTEQVANVPPHDSRTVELPWTAGVGRNMVKVQIFLA